VPGVRREDDPVPADEAREPSPEEDAFMQSIFRQVFDTDLPGDPPFDVDAGLRRLMDKLQLDPPVAYLSQHADEGQTDGGVSLCAVCGDEAEYECAICDRLLCEDHARTTSVPGDTFCQPFAGCQENPFT
jgi:hypothetical protein